MPDRGGGGGGGGGEGEEREERRVALRCQVGRVEADDATANVEVAAGPMPNVRYPLCGGALKI